MTPDVGHLEGRTVFVTGGTGSFGSAFTETVLDHTKETKLVIYSRSEEKHARMAETLVRHRDRIRFRLGDVRDSERLSLAMWRADVVVHCAALKRVDDTAMHPYELIKTNLLGTHNVLQSALDAGVKRTLVISSDKCVLAANAYGATKFLSECLAVAWNAISFARGQLVSCVRWGNVLGSTGSVLHAFHRAAGTGAPLLITDPQMTRFWWNLNQAVEFTCRSLRLMRGGEILIPCLSGASVDVLAKAIGSDLPMVCIGRRRGGEKDHEVLLSEHESHRAVRVDEMFILEPDWALPVEREPWKGQLLDAGFRYASNTAPQLDIQALRAMIA